MIIFVTKEVRVEVTSGDIMKFRKENQNCTNHGTLSRDDNIALILADTKAVDMINNRKGSVKTKTSIDQEADIHFE